MRYYTREDKQYKSVTSIINEQFPFNKEAFYKWCERSGYDPEVVSTISSSMGSKVSDWIDNSVRGLEFLNPPVIGRTETGLRSAVACFVKDVKVLSSEQTVYSDEYLYAGTYDGIVKYKDKEYLMDWKTYGAWKGDYKRDASKIKKVRLQLSMYNNAIKETEDRELPIAVVVFKRDGSYEIEELQQDLGWKDWFN